MRNRLEQRNKTKDENNIFLRGSTAIVKYLDWKNVSVLESLKISSIVQMKQTLIMIRFIIAFN